MLPLLINPLPLIFTITATFGVLVHDTQIDRATTVALTVPTAFASFVAIDSALKSGEQHVHVERVSMPQHLAALRSNLPRTISRDDDERRHINEKSIQYRSGGGSYLWPSI